MDTEISLSDTSLPVNDQNALLSGLFDNMPSGLAIYQVKNQGTTGSDYIIRFFNRASLAMDGLNEEDVVGKSLKELRPNIDSYGLIDVFRQVWQSGKPEYYPAKIYSDENFCNYYENYVFRLPTGEIVALYNDVTDRFVAAEKLKQSEERYRRYIECAPTGVFIANEHGCYLEANPASCLITGYSEQELLSMKIADLIPPEDRQLAADHFRRLNETGRSSGTMGLLRKDGSRGYWSVEAVTISQNRFMGFVQDITERKNTETAVRQNEEKFRKAFMVSPDALTITRTRDGIFLLVNQGFTEILGYTEEEIMGRSSLKLNIYADENDRRDIVALINKQGYVRNFEARFVKKNGEVVYGLMSASTITIDDVPCILSVTRDISLRKMAEENLVTKSKELEQFNKLMIGRELKMIELKKEVNELLKQLGLNEKYKVVSAE